MPWTGFSAEDEHAVSCVLAGLEDAAMAGCEVGDGYGINQWIAGFNAPRNLEPESRIMELGWRARMWEDKWLQMDCWPEVPRTHYRMSAGLSQYSGSEGFCERSRSGNILQLLTGN